MYSALLGEAVMARLLHELLLLSCVAAFAIGVVIAAASVFGLGGGLAAGQCPRPAHGVVQDGGAHSPFLLVVARCPWGCRGLGLAHPRSAITLGPARCSTDHGLRTGRVALMALAEALDAHRRRR